MWSFSLLSSGRFLYILDSSHLISYEFKNNFSMTQFLILSTVFFKKQNSLFWKSSLSRYSFMRYDFCVIARKFLLKITNTFSYVFFNMFILLFFTLWFMIYLELIFCVCYTIRAKSLFFPPHDIHYFQSFVEKVIFFPLYFLITFVKIYLNI